MQLIWMMRSSILFSQVQILSSALRPNLVTDTIKSFLFEISIVGANQIRWVQVPGCAVFLGIFQAFRLAARFSMTAEIPLVSLSHSPRRYADTRSVTLENRAGFVAEVKLLGQENRCITLLTFCFLRQKRSHFRRHFHSGNAYRVFSYIHCIFHNPVYVS